MYWFKLLLIVAFLVPVFEGIGFVIRLKKKGVIQEGGIWEGIRSLISAIIFLLLAIGCFKYVCSPLWRWGLGVFFSLGCILGMFRSGVFFAGQKREIDDSMLPQYIGTIIICTVLAVLIYLFLY